MPIKDQPTAKQATGSWGEDRAARFLSHAGYTIIERNYRARGGEIDIIAWHAKPHFGKTLCFIEVKTRQHDDGSAERATGLTKQQRMLRAARSYCMTQRINIERAPIQFEHVSIIGTKAEEPPQIRLYVLPIE